MDLCRLIYISEATQKFSNRELGKLAQRASANNESRGVTGLLLSANGSFMQVLEGNTTVVPSLYNQITRDSRHHNLRKLFHRQVNQRLFSHWGMKLIDNDDAQLLDRGRIEKALLRIRLSENSNDAADAIALLQEFQDQFLRGAA